MFAVPGDAPLHPHCGVNNVMSVAEVGHFVKVGGHVLPMFKSMYSQDKFHKVRSAPQCWRTCFFMLAFSLRSPALIQDFSTLRGEYQFTISISDRCE